MRRFVPAIAGLALAVASVAAAAVSATPAAAAPVASSASSSGVTLTVGARPASVPANYVVTPDGYFDPACVHQVNANQTLVRDGTKMAIVTIPASAATTSKNMAMQPAAGQSRAKPAYSVTARQIAAAPKVAACTHPRYSLNGTRVPQSRQADAPLMGSASSASSPSTASTASTQPTINGWVEDANTTSLGAMSYSHAQWNVPAAPSDRSSQTVYYFPGFENLSGTTMIMQPVLGWNAGGGIAGWSGASWNCCAVGNVYHSGFIQVTGSTVSGDVGGTGCNTSTGVCSNWSIVTYDWGSEASTTFNTNSAGNPMNWTFGGVLEAYGVSSCSEFPGTSVTYTSFYFDNITGAHVADPSWSHGTPGSGTSPSCGYSIGGSNSSVALHY